MKPNLFHVELQVQILYMFYLEDLTIVMSVILWVKTDPYRFSLGERQKVNPLL